jgi:magnesium transporter
LYSVKAILDANRNSLMLLDLKFSIGTLGIGSGAFIAALYGMNLKNFIEENDLGFWGVTGWSVVFAAIVCGYGLTKLRKVQRVSMWGEGGRRGRNWNDDDLDRGLASREIELGRREGRERHKRLREEKMAALEDGRAELIRQKRDNAIAAAVASRTAAAAGARKTTHW